MLLVVALREATAHAGRVFALARAETEANLGAVLRLTAILGAVPVVLVAAFFLGLDAMVKVVAALLGSEPAAALIVALPFLAAAAVLGMLAARRFAPGAARRG